MEDIITAFKGVYVEIEVNQLSLESRVKLQGAKVVKGVLIENKYDIVLTIALGFKSKKIINNNKYRYVLLLKGKFYPREADRSYRFIADENAVDVDVTSISGWFTAVSSKPVLTP